MMNSWNLQVGLERVTRPTTRDLIRESLRSRTAAVVAAPLKGVAFVGGRVDASPN